jgi:alpha-L-arabinofuranosidase
MEYRMNKLMIALLSICCLQAAEMQVDLGQAGKKVSPELFGIFLEEINHAGDGGLYAELIRNGSFTEAPTLDAWSAVRTGVAKVNLFFDDTTPLNPVKSRSLRIEINSPNGERAGVSNEGYWGIAIKQGESYQFSMYARGPESFDGPLTVRLEAKDGTVYGQAEITGLKTAWGRFSGSIAAAATDPAARLTICANHTGTFWLNMVSLRLGNDIFRADLLQKLKDLKPAFVRFPGGTYVQGNERETAFRWKNTIGDLESRPGHWNAPWVYWSTDNMGFHEYLLLCERLGATPMYVAYAGMTWTPNSKSPFGVLENHKIPVSDFPMDQMGPIVQDALDAIEYANGPVTSAWGGLRAKVGHPAPFGLKYIEIGNEDGFNPLYTERYMLFYNAIKARFPEIQIIANERRGRATAGELPMDFVDEHTYTRPLGALDMARGLDSRDRNGHKAVLAEYAVQVSGGFGNMRAALAEAVMLSGLERNSDVMPMASYAPLLANVHAINWRPDLIYFDNVSAYGTPSYYVQKMFADSRLDSVVPVEVKADDLKVRLDGAVTCEGYNAEAEFQDGRGTGTGDNYTYTVRARKIGGEGGIVIRFAQDGSGTYLAWFLGVRHRASTLHVWGGGGMLDVPAHQLESSFGGALARGVNGALDTGRWYDVKIQVEPRRVRCYLDGKEIHDVQVPESLGPSVYGLAGRAAAGEIVLRLVNVSPLKQNVSINLAGGTADRYSAVATYLTSKNLDEENSLAEPTKIAPVERQLPSVGSEFQYELEGNSFTVLRLTPERK